jgi:hypothetical protein
VLSSELQAVSVLAIPYLMLDEAGIMLGLLI